jgi:hypothetical protein
MKAVYVHDYVHVNVDVYEINLDSEIGRVAAK